MSSKPSIVLFFKGTSLGGAELSALSILECLRDQGWSTRLVSSAKGELFDRFAATTNDQLVVPFPYPRKPASWIHLPQFISKVRAFLSRDSKKQILFSGDFYTLWAALLFRSANRPVLSMWQGEYRFHDESCPKKWLRYGAGRADRLVASAPVAEHANQTGILPSKVFTLNPRTDEGRFNPALYDRELLRRNFGWHESDHIAVCIGRIGAAKGQPWLAKSFLDDPRFPKNARLVIAGPGHGADLEEIQRLQFASRGRIQFLGPRSDVPEILAAADLAIQPGTLAESFGLSALEAIMMNCPLLAFSVGALPYTLGKNYPLIPIDKRPQLMDEWLSAASKNIHHSCVNIVNMRQTALTSFGVGAWENQLQDLLKHIIK